MKKSENSMKRPTNRRAFLTNGMVAAGAATIGASLLPGTSTAFSGDGDSAPITKGDIAILTFLSALEQVEADLWIQYAELGGATNQGLSPIDLPFTGGLAPDYITGLLVLDGDMPQYISDNTDDEISHHRFLNNYLESKGAKQIDLSRFAILPPSRVTGVPQKGRLTNLKQLTIDTSWWTRYRSETANPDFGGTFENAVPDLAKGQHPAIPLSDGDLGVDANGNISNHLQAIANTAGFHFAFIEQGGSSLYPALAQKVTNLEVLRILLSIGGVEIDHFSLWHDKMGNAVAPPVAPFSDPVTGLTFPDFNNPANQNHNSQMFQTNLILPEPCEFLSPNLPPCSIIRPTLSANGGPMATVQSFIADGLFIGQNPQFLEQLKELASEAEAARREGQD